MIRLLAPALLLLPVPARAAERSVGIGSFTTLRVDGPFAVTVTEGSAHAAVAGDARLLDTVELDAEGTTLVVRPRRDGTAPTSSAAPIMPLAVRLATRDLATVTVVGGAKVTVARMQAPRVALSVTGSGALTVAAITADTAIVQIVGTGVVTAAGRATTVRLLANGTGTIEAGALEASDLFARLDGPGVLHGRARYTAQVISTGLGTVTIEGNAKCRLPLHPAGPIRCGAGQ